ncbi:hypothetical protein MTO96_000305 [Rhipicephalus appendiculatus]
MNGKIAQRNLPPTNLPQTQAVLTFDGNHITGEEAEWDAFADSYGADIARLLRKDPKKNGPSLEGDLLSALSPSQVQYVIHVYGTLAAFMDHRPEFELTQGVRYTFVYYEYLDGEERGLQRLITYPGRA